MQHEIAYILLGTLHRAPIQDIPDMQIMDVGTGTGIWALEMALEYPSAQILGTDLGFESQCPHTHPPQTTKADNNDALLLLDRPNQLGTSDTNLRKSKSSPVLRIRSPPNWYIQSSMPFRQGLMRGPSRFEIEDAECEWTHEDNFFDFIHSRNIGQAIDDWPRLVSQMYRYVAGFCTFIPWDALTIL